MHASEPLGRQVYMSTPVEEPARAVALVKSSQTGLAAKMYAAHLERPR